MSKPLPPSRTAEQYIVRFPEGMRDRIADEAKKNNRSMNAEIVARLAASFEDLAADGRLRNVELTVEQIRDFLREMSAKGMVTRAHEPSAHQADDSDPGSKDSPAHPAKKHRVR